MQPRASSIPQSLDPPVDRQDERWQLLERVLASPGFFKSPRLSSFLTYICECEISGKTGNIHETQIGIHVFGRSPGYNPSEDSVVRSQARLLRQKLEEYFESSGRDEQTRIFVPKGSYIPQFLKSSEQTPIEPVPDEIAAPAAEIPASTLSRAGRIRSVSVIAVLLLVSGLLAADIWVHLRGRPGALPEPQPFWTALFNPRQRTIIVPSDSTLVFLEELTRTKVGLTEYSDHSYLNKMPLPAALAPLTVDDLGGHQYTSMADLNLAVRLARLPETAHGRVEVRFARNLTLTDMKEANLILIGGERANPWTELFERQTSFHVSFDSASKTNAVVDLNPQKGSPSAYVERSTNTEHLVYGVVAFLPGMCDGCDALLVQGTSMAGTEGASDFLFGNQGFREFIHKIARPDGSVQHFELLLQTSSIGGNAPQASIIAYHLLP